MSLPLYYHLSKRRQQSKPTLLCIYSTSAVKMQNRRCFLKNCIANPIILSHTKDRQKDLEVDLNCYFTQWFMEVKDCFDKCPSAQTLFPQHAHTPSLISEEKQATTDTIKTGLLYIVLQLLQYTQSAVKFTLTRKSPLISPSCGGQ